MSIFARPHYTSDATQFIESLKAAKPELEAEQREGRALLWDKQVDRDQQAQANAARVAHRAELVPLLRQVTVQRSTAQWIAALETANVPCGPINTLEQVFADPHVQARGLRVELPHPVAGTTHVFAPPYRLDGQRLPIRNAPPTLGAATREVLQQLLQLPEAELEALRDKGVLTLPSL